MLFSPADLRDKASYQEVSSIGFPAYTRPFAVSADPCLLSVLQVILEQNQQREVIALNRQGTQQQRPESPHGYLTWHASKYRVHKLHRRYILVFLSSSVIKHFTIFTNRLCQHSREPPPPPKDFKSGQGLEVTSANRFTECSIRLSHLGKFLWKKCLLSAVFSENAFSARVLGLIVTVRLC